VRWFERRRRSRRNVDFVAAGHGLDEEIDAGYGEKYGYPSSAVDHITSPEARETTIRLVPRSGAITPGS